MLLDIRKDVHGKEIIAVDGGVGLVVDTCFDDERWAVRYLVVDAGGWLGGRQVLVSPASLSPVQPAGDSLRVELTRERVRSSPAAEADRPVSRQFEVAHAKYYGYPFYWDGPYLWGKVQYPVGERQPFVQPLAGDITGERVEELAQLEQQARESRLRSSKEVTRYRLVATDGPVGHVEDLVMDDRDWSIPYLEVDTRDWLPGGVVRLPVGAVRQIDWVSREVRVDATRDEVRHGLQGSRPGTPRP